MSVSQDHVDTLATLATLMCPFPAKATEITSPWAFSPKRLNAGYFIVILLPKLPSIHSTLEFYKQMPFL